jgi:hypothetical protein
MVVTAEACMTVRRMFQILLLFIIIFSGVAGATAQCESGIYDEGKTISEPGVLKEWKRQKVGRISFCLPERVEFTYVMGIDLNSWRFEDNNWRIVVYLGHNAPTVSGYAQLAPDFRLRDVSVNGIPGVQWSHTDKNAKFPYRESLRLFRDGRAEGDGAGLFIQMNDPELRLKAKKLFVTVLFGDEQN